jgi:putative nucleotidyltransferase with HDIG domain
MEYVSIRVSTLRGDQKINFNVYVKINNKHILYLRQGDSFEGLRLKRLKEKKLKKMFISSEDEAGYLDYMKRNIEMAYDQKSGKPLETRSEIIHGQQQSCVEQVYENPESVEIYNDTKQNAGLYVDFLLKETKAVSTILNIENIDKSKSHHSVSVATISVALAEKLKVDSKLIGMLALGALLHDLGHSTTNLDTAMPTSFMNADELKLFREHPKLGAEIAQDKKHFDQLVVKIIKEHEELLDGSGFPAGLKENQIDELSKIVSSCNAFDRLVTFEGIPRTEVAKKMIIERVGQHPLNHLQGISEIIKAANQALVATA